MITLETSVLFRRWEEELLAGIDFDNLKSCVAFDETTQEAIAPVSRSINRGKLLRLVCEMRAYVAGLSETNI